MYMAFLQSIFLLLIVCANCINATDNCFDGFYTGPHLGLNAIVAKKSSAMTFTGLGKSKTDSETYKTSGGLGANGLVTGVFAGYGKTFHDAYYLGVDTYSNMSRNEMVLYKSNNTTQKINNSSNCGIKLRMGWLVSPTTMLYVGLGQEYSTWKFTTTASGDNDINVKAQKLHLTYTGGIETHLHQDIFLRGEYMYVKGPEIRISSKSRATSISSDSKIAVAQHRVILGLGYRF